MLGEAGGDQPRPPFEMIPCQRPVVKAKGQVGNSETVGGRGRQPLEGAPELVAKVSRESALKGRKPGNRLGPEWSDDPTQLGERISGDCLTNTVRQHGAENIAPLCLDDHGRVRREKRISTKSHRVGSTVQPDAMRPSCEPLTAGGRIGDRTQLLHQWKVSHRAISDNASPSSAA